MTTEGEGRGVSTRPLHRDKPVAVYFNSNRHSINNVQASVLENVHGQSKSLRIIQESKWMYGLDTKFPLGLTSKEVRQI